MQARPAASLEGRLFGAFLFDMDGTILDSMAVVDRVWGRWAQAHGLDPSQFLPTIHGVRAVDTIQRLQLEGVDAHREAALIAAAEMADVDGVIAITGAPAFLHALPAKQWAIVTSAPRELAWRRLQAANLPFPSVLIAAEDVVVGKPAPEGYERAAAALGVSVTECLIFEDAPAGIQAAEAAGGALLVITAAHPLQAATRHPEIIDYRDLRAAVDQAGRLRVVVASFSSSDPAAAIKDHP